MRFFYDTGVKDQALRAAYVVYGVWNGSYVGILRRMNGPCSAAALFETNAFLCIDRRSAAARSRPLTRNPLKICHLQCRIPQSRQQGQAVEALGGVGVIDEDDLKEGVHWRT